MSDEPTITPSVPRAVRLLGRASRDPHSARAAKRKRTANLPTGPRTQAYLVRVSEEEKAEIEHLASLAGVKGPRLLRESVLAPQVPVSADEFRELVHELFRVQSALRGLGNNVTQIAKVVNATHELGDKADALEHLLSAVQRYADRAGAAIEVVTRW